MKSETAKLPKGQSYLLKPSALETALAAARIEIDTHLIRSPGDLFDANFLPPNQNVGYERLYIRAGSVPFERAATDRLWVDQVVIPGLIAWIGSILALDARSPIRRESQYLYLRSL